MADPGLLEGVGAEIVDTPRLRTHLLAGGVEGGAPGFFVHGNTSSSRFFEETLATLPPEAGFWGIAPHLRGLGGSVAQPVGGPRPRRRTPSPTRAARRRRPPRPPKAGFWGIAPDLRGFGGSETKPLDATRGLGDFSDDLYALASASGLRDRMVHLVGWSMGGMVAMGYVMDKIGRAPG